MLVVLEKESSAVLQSDIDDKYKLNLSLERQREITIKCSPKERAHHLNIFAWVVLVGTVFTHYTASTLIITIIIICYSH